LSNLSYQTSGIGFEDAESLAFLGVFKDPVNSSEVIVADAAAGTFDIPVYTCCVLTIAVQGEGV
jgi:hypothetical protein